MPDGSAIDRTIGALTIQTPSMVLSPDLTKVLLVSSPLGPLCRKLNEHVPWSVFGMTGMQIGGERFSGTVCFHHERLEYVTLTCGKPEFGYSLANLSQEKERARQRFHNDWLKRQGLDHPVMASAGSDTPAWTWQFPWGRIVSGWDVKNGTTEIVIRYRQDGR